MIGLPSPQPKLKALSALPAAVLSTKGTLNALRLAATCPTCRSAAAGVELYERLAREATATAAPRLDFVGIDRVLRQEAAALSRRSRVALLLPWAVAAAALLALSVSLRMGPTATDSVVRPSATPSRPLPAPAPFTAYVTLLRGHGTARAQGAETKPLEIDSALHQNDTVVLAAESRAELFVDGHAALGVEADTTLVLRALNGHAIELDLAHGAVISHVRARRPIERYRVFALGYTVEVRGTLFRVAAVGGKLSVAVDEGRVVVLDASGGQVADLVAPAKLDVGGTVVRESSGLSKPRSLTLPLRAWPPVRLPALPDVSTWTFDGRTEPAGAGLAMRVPTGENAFVVTLRDGSERRVVIEVPEGGALLNEAALRSLLALDDTPEPRKAPSASKLQEVITRGTPALQRCYERSLKRAPELSGKLLLRVVVDARGRVRSVTPRGQATGLPEELLGCIRESASRWQFPAPGGLGITFDAPIRLGGR